MKKGTEPSNCSLIKVIRINNSRSADNIHKTRRDSNNTDHARLYAIKNHGKSSEFYPVETSHANRHKLLTATA